MTFAIFSLRLLFGRAGLRCRRRTDRPSPVALSCRAGRCCLILRRHRRELNSTFDSAHHLYKLTGRFGLKFSSRALFDVGKNALCFPRVAVWALRAQRIVDVTDVDQLARFVAIARVVLVRVSFPAWPPDFPARLRGFDSYPFGQSALGSRYFSWSRLPGRPSCLA